MIITANKNQSVRLYYQPNNLNFADVFFDFYALDGTYIGTFPADGNILDEPLYYYDYTTPNEDTYVVGYGKSDAYLVPFSIKVGNPSAIFIYYTEIFIYYTETPLDTLPDYRIFDLLGVVAQEGTTTEITPNFFYDDIEIVGSGHFILEVQVEGEYATAEVITIEGAVIVGSGTIIITGQAAVEAYVEIIGSGEIIISGEAEISTEELPTTFFTGSGTIIISGKGEFCFTETFYYVETIPEKTNVLASKLLIIKEKLARLNSIVIVPDNAKTLNVKSSIVNKINQLTIQLANTIENLNILQNQIIEPSTNAIYAETTSTKPKTFENAKSQLTNLQNQIIVPSTNSLFKEQITILPKDRLSIKTIKSRIAALENIAPINGSAGILKEQSSSSKNFNNLLTHAIESLYKLNQIVVVPENNKLLKETSQVNKAENYAQMILDSINKIEELSNIEGKNRCINV